MKWNSETVVAAIVLALLLIIWRSLSALRPFVPLIVLSVRLAPFEARVALNHLFAVLALYFRSGLGSSVSASQILRISVSFEALLLFFFICWVHYGLFGVTLGESAACVGVALLEDWWFKVGWR